MTRVWNLSWPRRVQIVTGHDNTLVRIVVPRKFILALMRGPRGPYLWCETSAGEWRFPQQIRKVA